MSTNVSEVRAASIIRAMMAAARTSETSGDIQLRTRQYIPEDSELHIRRRENLKSHKIKSILNSGNALYHTVHNLLSSNGRSIHAKIKT
jgi:ribosomal protein S16